jgi:putative endonuclease
MLRCADDSLYTGITTDLDRRLAEHRGQQGRGARYLRGRGPLTVALSGPVGSHSLALKVELRIKKMSRREKERLVAADDGLQSFLRGLRLLGDGARLG